MPPRSRTARGPAARRAPPTPPASDVSASRFRSLDRYRADREWVRYEGTPQRELWRELRERFLVRHASRVPWALDLGSGPGRFTRFLGGSGSRRVALDLSYEMLRALAERWPRGRESEPLPDRVRGDGLHPPFREGAFGEVGLLGNALGFAGPDSVQLWEAARTLVAGEGTVVVEVAPASGERSSYLARLPPSTVGRLFRSPVRAVLGRVEREPFVPMPARRREPGSFERLSAEQVAAELARSGWDVVETIAVAPALGTDATRVEAVGRDPKAWGHLLEVEELLGRRPERWKSAASVLLAAVRRSVKTSP